MGYFARLAVSFSVAWPPTSRVKSIGDRSVVINRKTWALAYRRLRMAAKSGGDSNAPAVSSGPIASRNDGYWAAKTAMQRLGNTGH